MTRYEFTKATKRDALKRSDGRCEASGEVYGLEPGTRCDAPLSHGVEFDHYPDPATDKGSNRLDNCAAVCIKCHRFKTARYDIPMQAKGKRIRDKHAGIRNASRMQGPGFRKAGPQRRATSPLEPKFDGDILTRNIERTTHD